MRSKGRVHSSLLLIESEGVVLLSSCATAAILRVCTFRACRSLAGVIRSPASMLSIRVPTQIRLVGTTALTVPQVCTGPHLHAQISRHSCLCSLGYGIDTLTMSTRSLSSFDKVQHVQHRSDCTHPTSGARSGRRCGSRKTSHCNSHGRIIVAASTNAMDMPAFHIAFPVRDVEEARTFYGG